MSYIDKKISQYKQEKQIATSKANSWSGISNLEYKHQKEKEAMLEGFLKVLESIKEDQSLANTLTLPTSSMASS